jgi:hypothetical protein
MTSHEFARSNPTMTDAQIERLFRSHYCVDALDEYKAECAALRRDYHKTKWIIAFLGY